MSPEQTKALRGCLPIFATGYLQVIFVAANVSFIAHYNLAGNLLTAFLLSLVWSWNVKRIAFGGWLDRFAYAGGAALGSVSGTIITHWMLT